MTLTNIIRFELILVLLICVSCDKEINYNEKYYSKEIQNKLGGEMEFRVEGGRVDLLTEDRAYEIEWASNWKEAIGQALWYGLQSNKKPGIILIMKSKKDYKYYLQLNSALNYASLASNFEVLVYPNDFEL